MRWKPNEPEGMVRANGSEGRVSFGGRRALVLDVEGLQQVRKGLVETMGVLEAGKLLSNWGYANGFQDATAIRRSFQRKSQLEFFQAGLELLALRGFARARVVEGNFDEASDGILISVEWKSPWEVECNDIDRNQAALQSCTTIAGYLGGFASAVTGGPAHFLDTKCCARGDEHCFAVAKSTWFAEDEEMRILGKFAEEVTSEKVDLNERIAENAPNTERIRSLIIELESQRAEIETLQSQVQYLQEIGSEEKPVRDLIGASPAYKRALRSAQKVAPTDSTVLLQGETGTGKELFARFIHANSHLKNRPLITVNCAALPSSLIESELFGHEKGAFTGAVQRKLGRFEIANGATIFLDEIGELPLETQAKFLRVLQEGEFERLGGTQTIRVSVRVLAATNQSLETQVSEGKFRSDLFYRLNVFPIEIPPLRARTDDLEPLINYFTQKYRRQFHKPLTSVSRSSIERLKEYSFPGNVRELQHLIERSVLLSEGEVLEIDLPLPRRPGNEEYADGGDEILTLDEMERRYIESVLRKTRGAIAGRGGAAELLGLPPSTLRSRMSKLGLK